MPELRLQHAFSEIVKRVEATQQEQMLALKMTDDFFNSLLQRAFSGELWSNVDSGTSVTLETSKK